jgi:hypothetical protein
VSRGPGRVQRFVLAELAALPAGAWFTANELAERFYGEVTDAGLEAMRRALRTLGKAGALQLGTTFAPGAPDWRCPDRKHLAARLPVGDEVAAAEQREREARAELYPHRAEAILNSRVVHSVDGRYVEVRVCVDGVANLEHPVNAYACKEAK